MKLNKRYYDGNVDLERAQEIYQLGNIIREGTGRYLFCKFRGYYYAVEITKDIYLRELINGEWIPAERADYTHSVSDYVSPQDIKENLEPVDVDRDDESAIGRVLVIGQEPYIVMPSRKRYFLARMRELRDGADLNKLRKYANKFDSIEEIIEEFDVKKELI